MIYFCFYLACEIGYFGVNYESKCPFPLYGHACQMMCTCKDEYCDFADGCSQPPPESTSIHMYLLFICMGWFVFTSLVFTTFLSITFGKV